MHDLHTQLTIFFDKRASARQTRRATRRVQQALDLLLRGQPDAADLRQAALTRLVKARAGDAHRVFDSAQQARAYLRRVVRSACVTAARHADPQPRPQADRTDTAAFSAPTQPHALSEALARLKRAEVPRALARRHRRDHRQHLTHGTRLRARQIEAAMLGHPAPPTSTADAKASRRAAQALRAVYQLSDPDPVHRMIAQLVRLDLRSISHRGDALRAN